MSKPTKEQLAPHVPPMVREYVNACVNEAIESLTNSVELRLESMRQVELSINSAMERVKQEGTEAAAELSSQLKAIAADLRAMNARDRADMHAEIRALKGI